MLSSKGARDTELRKKIFHIFTRTHGLTLHSSARKFIEDELIVKGYHNSDSLDAILNEIASAFSSSFGMISHALNSSINLCLTCRRFTVGP
jgi:hypothetical protein